MRSPAVNTLSTLVGSERQDSGMPVRVFLLDDHELVRRGIRDLLWAEDDLEVVGDASTAEEALERIPQHPSRRRGTRRPPRERIRHRGVPGDPLVASRGGVCDVDQLRDDEAMFASIMAGASGYVLKQIRGSELVESIRRVAAGESLLDPFVTAWVLERLRNPQPQEPDPLPP